jgi:hypothetical protein
MGLWAPRLEQDPEQEAQKFIGLAMQAKGNLDDEITEVHIKHVAQGYMHGLRCEIPGKR